MKKSGAFLARYALEQVGVQYTFGIPGVHNTELYDELNKSKQIEPILVTHEAGASFMADAISRTSDSIGTLAIVPAAGTTHAMSGIGEAFLDGIPMLIISGGVRRDSDKSYQLHQLDQEKLVGAIVKKYILITRYEDIIPSIYLAYEIATNGEPGPVFVEIPVNLQLFEGEISGIPEYHSEKQIGTIDNESVESIVELLHHAKKPCIYAGWGAVNASDELVHIAELLQAPVATTLQGKSVFPDNHPLHTGVGFGSSSVPAAENAFKNCDCLIAVGARFGELATGSYGMRIPPVLVHIDINPEVFNKNYKAAVAIEGDSREVLSALIDKLKTEGYTPRTNFNIQSIQEDKEKYFGEWLVEKKKDIVSPGHFFKSLRAQSPDDVLMVVDDGKHTFLASELFPVVQPRHFISPTDFNCMGYCVPAAIGAQLANPDKKVVAIVGDGAFMMTGLELVTAKTYRANVIVFVFHDGELGQISQFQKIPMNRKTCSVIGDINIEGVAIATGVEFISIENDMEISSKIEEAFSKSEEGPVLVDVKIDYSKKTRLTKGVVKTNFGRFPLKEKIRFLSRAAKRHILG